jgi:TrmH family RNA methyltransferase
MTHGPQPAPVTIASRDNPLIKQLRRLSEQGTAYRRTGQFWIEGEHLCSAAVARGMRPAVLVVAASRMNQVPGAWLAAAARTVVLEDRLFADLSALESPSHVGFVIDLPTPPAQPLQVASVVLDRVQDAGNVGSILRSAAAFGFRQVLALQGTAGLWSAKVLRAGMGAHFGLQLIEGLQADDVRATGLPLLVTSSHQGQDLQQEDPPWPCAWVFGHEGQGVSALLLEAAARRVRIPQPGGEESLNVAAAAAICLYASARVGTR